MNKRRKSNKEWEYRPVKNDVCNYDQPVFKELPESWKGGYKSNQPGRYKARPRRGSSRNSPSQKYKPSYNQRKFPMEIGHWNSNYEDGKYSSNYKRNRGATKPNKYYENERNYENKTPRRDSTGSNRNARVEQMNVGVWKPVTQQPKCAKCRISRESLKKANTLCYSCARADKIPQLTKLQQTYDFKACLPVMNSRPLDPIIEVKSSSARKGSLGMSSSGSSELQSLPELDLDAKGQISSWRSALPSTWTFGDYRMNISETAKKNLLGMVDLEKDNLSNRNTMVDCFNLQKQSVDFERYLRYEVSTSSYLDSSPLEQSYFLNGGSLHGVPAENDTDWDALFNPASTEDLFSR